jgi:hypothetical protein
MPQEDQSGAFQVMATRSLTGRPHCARSLGRRAHGYPLDMSRFESAMNRLSTPVALVFGVIVVVAIGWAVDAVIGLTVAAVICELAGLAFVARWLRIDLKALITGAIRLSGSTGSVRPAASLSIKKTPETLEDLSQRFDREIADVRAQMLAANIELRGEIQTLESKLPTLIKQQTKDPALGLALIVVGVILSAVANVVGA